MFRVDTPASGWHKIRQGHDIVTCTTGNGYGQPHCIDHSASQRRHSVYELNENGSSTLHLLPLPNRSKYLRI
jgi:hypothetical protein